MADDYRRREAEGMSKGRYVGCEIASAIACCGAIRITMAPLRQGKGVDGLRQVGQHTLE
jgi:hypothetical protein